MNAIYHLLLGAAAGWAAGKIMSGKGYGIVSDIIMGLVGGWFGGWIGEKIGVNIGGGNIGYFITALIGAVLLVALSRLVKKIL